ncbi:MAG: aldo/keto reductase [Candidatus Omnitrophica bacterium]|nr:aldo/keto reductase [Candidatus Omnitrophota bacterium]
MHYRSLGRTQLRVSEIGFGCWAIGGNGYGPTRDEDSLSALETAWDHGVNFYDTADTYGHGHSEDLLACFLRTKPRDEVVVATKAGWDFYHGGSRKNFESDYLQFACDQSLKRLQTDVIDIYQMHNPTLEIIERGQIFESLQNLKRAGKIRFCGVSVHRPEEALACIRDGRVDTLQLVLSLLEQKMTGEVLKEASKAGVGVIVREPLACGLLSANYPPDYQFHKNDHRRRWLAEKRESDWAKVQIIQKKIEPWRISLIQAALEYVLSHTEVSTVIPGAKRRQQVAENLLATENPVLSREQVEDLSQTIH